MQHKDLDQAFREAFPDVAPPHPHSDNDRIRVLEESVALLQNQVDRQMQAIRQLRDIVKAMRTN